MILYLETSNLVKLYVKEKDSDRIKKIVEQAGVVATSVIAYAETRAALARKRREKGIEEKGYRRIKKEIDRDWENYFILNLTDEVAKSSGDLAEKYGLRGFDALHLASALLLKKEVSLSVAFSSSDIKLSRAAEREGLKTPVVEE